MWLYAEPVFTYVVTSYANARQTIRLLARLRTDSPACRLIVSHDRKIAPPPAPELEALGARLCLTPEPITWGDSTYLRSQLHAIACADLEPGDWVTILTGQDYPIAPLRRFEHLLSTCDADMLLEEPDEADPQWEAMLERYRRRSYAFPRWADHHRIRQVLNRVPRMAVAPEPRGLPSYLHWRRLRTPFTDRFRLYKGCDLYALSFKAARRLIAAPPALLRYYGRTRVPSESYVHTVLRNDHTLTNLPGMLHYTRWEASPHPAWLTTADLDDMLASGYWFARKFHPDEPVLDVLDAHLDDFETP